MTWRNLKSEVRLQCWIYWGILVRGKSLDDLLEESLQEHSRALARLRELDAQLEELQQKKAKLKDHGL